MGLAVYGGDINTFRNLCVADTLVYSGITGSSLSFGHPVLGFGPQHTTIQNASIVWAGGHFYGAQTFPTTWMFSASKEFRGIRDAVRGRAGAATDPGHGAHERQHHRRPAPR